MHQLAQSSLSKWSLSDESRSIVAVCVAVVVGLTVLATTGGVVWSQHLQSNDQPGVHARR